LSPAMPRPSVARTVLAALLFAAALGAAAPARAQLPGLPGGRGQPAAQAPGDTARGRVVPPDTTRVNGVSPKGAFLRSMLVPGWGQSSIGSPGRGGVYFALEAGSLWMVYKAQLKVEDARRREHELRNSGMLEDGRQTGLLHSRLSQREDWITLSGFWLFFSGADAFVATHLANFNAHVGAIPRPDGAVQVQATVPVGKKP
ncbi:MAG TPA: hypothetical protein VFH27_12485, partial [Longimicrobiaceae bacterium]|nr:hypothetical protein [Longimicrobiaceae bacterium]